MIDDDIPAMQPTIDCLDAIVWAIPPGQRCKVASEASKVEVKLRAALILLDEVREWMERTGHSDIYLLRMIACVTGRSAGVTDSAASPPS